MIDNDDNFAKFYFDIGLRCKCLQCARGSYDGRRPVQCLVGKEQGSAECEPTTEDRN